jgi:hypothetical protein
MGWWKVSVLGVVLGGCGCGDGDDEGGVSMDELAAELAAARCERAFACCEPAEREAELGFFNIESEEACTTFLAGLLEEFHRPRLEAAIDSGRIVYHPARMEACLSLMRSIDCGGDVDIDSPHALGDGCEDPFEGQVPPGGLCATDEECAEGVCIGESHDLEGNMIRGMCGELPEAGRPCAHFECAEGAWCDGPHAGGPTCAAPQPDGADCFSPRECASGNCADDNPGDRTPGECVGEPYCDGA